MIGDFDFSEPKGKPLDTSIPAVRIATGTDTKPEPTTHRAWCGLCGTYVYDKERLPCADKPNFSWDNCGLNGQKTEQVPVSYRKDNEEAKAQVARLLKHQKQHHQDNLKDNIIPLSADGVQDLLQRDPGDETDSSPPTSVKRSLVEEAMSITDGARRKAYGTPEDNFGRIAHLWEAYDVAKYGRGDTPDNTSHDVAMKMILMKIARIIETPDHRDSYTDVIGYILCGAEIAGVK